MPILCVLIAMISIQTGASLAKQLFPLAGILGTTALRISLASLVLALIWKPWKLRLTYKQVKSIIPYGASLGLMNLFFYCSLEHIPLGIAVALEFIGPLCVALFSSRRPVDYLWALLAALGIVLILPINKHVPSLNFLGIFFALLAGLFWAGYIIFGQKMEVMKGGLNVCLGMIVAAFFAAPAGLIVDGTRIFSLNVLPIALGVAILSSALPYSLEMIGLRTLPAKTFAIMMSLEPAFGALSGFVFLKETLAVQQWIAILCVIAASAGSSLIESKRLSATAS